MEIQFEREEWDEVHAFENFLDTEWVSNGHPPDWEDREGMPYRVDGNYWEDEDEDEDY
jgi:hypothetical protein